MNTQPKFAVRTAAKHECLIHHNFFTLAIRKVDISHCNSEIAVDLNTILGCIVIVTSLNPMLECKTGILRVVFIATDEIGERGFLATAERILAPMALPVLGGLLISDEVVDLFLPVRFFWIRKARWQKIHQQKTAST